METIQLADRAASTSKDGHPSLLLEFYTTMVRIRTFEEELASLIEQGEIKTPCHLYIGQEAVATGVCAALGPRDTIWGGHRSHGHYLAKGGDLPAMMAEIFAKASGCSGGRGGSMHLIAKDVGILGTVPIVAGTVPLAVGAGLAAVLRGEPSVSVAFFGDGAAGEGHVHESVSLAALFRLPVIFVCENNFYSSHMHLAEHRPLDNLYCIGELYGIPAVREDGNDVLAVYHAASRAVERARTGESPSFLELRTFRWRGHVGASWDTDVGVRRKDELKDWLPGDPILQARNRLLASGVEPGALDRIEQAVGNEVAGAIEFARQSPRPSPDEVLSHVFSAPPAPLR